MPATSSPADAFVGRVAELVDLCDSFDDVRAGRGRLYLLCGDAGIGKTALADEAERRAAALGFLPLWGRCWKGGGAPAYWPWVQLIRAALRSPAASVLDQLPGVGSELARVVPELADRGEVAPAAGKATPEQERFRLFDSVTTFLRAAANERPLFLVLDDVQWADEASLVLLHFVARELRSAAILIIVTYRDAEVRTNETVASLLTKIGREGTVHLLGGLDRDDVEELVRHRAGREVSAELLAEIVRLTEGHPLYVEEVVHLVRAERRFDRPSDLRVPEGVRELIRRRLEELSTETRTVLAAAAVLGREFDIGTVEKVVGGNVVAAVHIDDAVAAGVLFPAAQRRDRYRFAHALIGETLYDDLPMEPKVQFHRRAATALLERAGSDVEAHLDELAHHFLGAAPGGDVAAAVDWAVRAGEHAVSKLAFESGASAFARAIELMQSTAPPIGEPTWKRRCVDLQIRLGRARLHVNDLDGAGAAFRGAATAARDLGEPILFAHATLGLGAASFERGGSDLDLVALLREALELLGDRSPALRSRLLSRLALSSYLHGPGRQQLELTREALDLARQCGDLGAIASALNARHSLCWQREDAEERLPLATEIVRVATEAGEEEAALDGLGWQIFDLLEVGDLHAAGSAISEYERRADAAHLPRQRWYACVFRTMQAMLRGDFVDAERLAEKGLTIRQADGAPPSQFYAGQLFTIRREQGRLKELEPAVQSVAKQYASLPAWQCVIALIYASVGDIDLALATFGGLSARDYEDLPVDVTWLSSVSMLAETCALLGDGRRARILYALLLPYAGRNVVVVSALVVRGAVDYFLGLLANTMNDDGLAAKHFAAAGEAHERLGAWPLLAHSNYELGRALQRQNPGDARAAALIDQALASARNLGLHSLEQRIAADASPSTNAAFTRDGDHWAVRFGGKVVRLKDSRGCFYVARLLQRPAEVCSAVELTRAAGGASTGEEQARIAVRKAIRAVLRTLTTQHPALATHLETALRTGRDCMYQSTGDVVWTVEGLEAK